MNREEVEKSIKERLSAIAKEVSILTKMYAEVLEEEKKPRTLKRYTEAGLSSVKLTYCYLKHKPEMKAIERDILDYVGELFTDPSSGIWALKKLGFLDKEIDDDDGTVWCILDRQLTKDDLTNAEMKAKKKSLDDMDEESIESSAKIYNVKI